MEYLRQRRISCLLLPLICLTLATVTARTITAGESEEDDMDTQASVTFDKAGYELVDGFKGCVDKCVKSKSKDGEQSIEDFTYQCHRECMINPNKYDNDDVNNSDSLVGDDDDNNDLEGNHHSTDGHSHADDQHGSKGDHHVPAHIPKPVVG